MRYSTVGDVMTREVVTVPYGCPFKEIARTLARHRVAAVPVVDDRKRPVGVVAETDLLGHEAGRGLAASGRDPVREGTAGTLMTSPAVTARPEWSLAEAARTMLRRGVGRLVVVGADERVTGIVSGHDLLRPYLRGDAALADEIRHDVLERILGLTPGRVRVHVEDGVVTLTGRTDAATDPPVIVRLCRSVPGVVAVHSHLTCAYGGADLDVEPPRPGAPRAAAGRGTGRHQPRAPAGPGRQGAGTNTGREPGPTPGGSRDEHREGSEMNIETRCGRSINVTRFAPHGLPASMGRVVLEASCTPQDKGEMWASMTPEEARSLAALLLFQAAAVEPVPTGPPGRVEVVPVAGDAYEIRVRGHVLTADQPASDGGKDTAPTPVELFVASVAACAAHYAGRFLDRHGVSRDGLRVDARFRMADDRPARVAALSLTVEAPALPRDRLPALRAVVSHCTVSNTLAQPPETQLEVVCGAEQEPAVPAPEGSTA
ncbi:CBS domain-containing protein [Streptomyces sp. NPDC020801]|uniref:CBS domain-containing protein n=1 Tax=unclassified Streptomyces TaxID=2593676 RepID=UPI0037BA768C